MTGNQFTPPPPGMMPPAGAPAPPNTPPLPFPEMEQQMQNLPPAGVDPMPLEAASPQMQQTPPEEDTSEDARLEKGIEHLNIHQRIAKVMSEVSYIQKDVNVAFGKTKYNAISEAKVTSEVRKALIKYGLTFLPIAQEVGRRGDVTTVQVTYKITNIDDPSDSIEIVSAGEGADTQDKGVGKALTYAYKYALLRTFAIATGDDPDLTSNEELETNRLPNKQQLLVDQFNQLYINATQRGHQPMNITHMLTQALGFVFSSPDQLSSQQLNTLIGVLQRF